MKPEIINAICKDICELPDRSSPDDWPDAMLVTAEELTLILDRHLLPRITECVPGLWRCAKCGFELSTMNLNVNAGTVTMRDEPGDKCPNDGSPMWRVSYREAYEQLAELANSERFASITVIERLVESEGASVTLLCQNPDGAGPDDHAILVNDDWTNYEDRRFYGPTRFDALCKAEDARRAFFKEQPNG
jgi:hypothetical protein